MNVKPNLSMPSPSGFRLFSWIVILAVLATLVGGFWLAGSPQQERFRRADAQRLQQLQQIANGVDAFWQQNQRLPANLEELQTSRSFFAGPEGVRDPESNELYRYQPQTSSTYELCATFQTATLAETNPPHPVFDGPAASGFWNHGVGLTCFRPSILNAKNPMGKF